MDANDKNDTNNYWEDYNDYLHEHDSSGYETEYYSNEDKSYNTETECEYIGFMEKLTDDEIVEAETEINERIDEFVTENILRMSSPDFSVSAINELCEQIFDEWMNMGICNDDDEEELREWIGTLFDLYFESMDIPKRQEIHVNGDVNVNGDVDIDYSEMKHYNETKQKMDILKSAYNYDQKSIEWHYLRKNMITASNAWKAFSTDAQKNSLIYEKCKCVNEPDNAESELYLSGINKNITSTLHWGQKYEPVSIEIYQLKNKVKVEEYSCIVHRDYSFLGASPDGIVCEGAYYGRMIEVKNIVNRVITGIPLEAYWVQMQIQMEVCDLDECDFIETRFKEYENEECFFENAGEDDGCNESNIRINKGGEVIQGVMCLFHSNDGQYSLMYKYMPFSVKQTRENVKAWIRNTVKEMKGTWTYYNTTYWYLEEYSCILVKRNKLWFHAAIPVLSDVWNTIEYERVNGYSHRVAKKRERSSGLSTLNPNLMNISLLGKENTGSYEETDERWEDGEENGENNMHTRNVSDTYKDKMIKVMNFSSFQVVKKGYDDDAYDDEPYNIE
jgi:hypothetical protein